MSTPPPLFGVTGWKNSGKTTLVTRLITEFTRRGYRVNSVKHAHHAFDIDVPGTDSFRHREAGASEVAVVSGARWALMHELRDDDEPAMADIVGRLSPADLVLVEGYKRENHPKIECRREATMRDRPLSASDLMIVAVAADFEAETGGLPRFALDDIAAIADFIAAQLALPAPARQTADAAPQTA
ncbi:molybdopterin-guanine dinucleotide biosynthesis protein B [Microbaculum marinum]|uniref:Molybdopterin-guanine dinucleotide biosynthesis protein B n=1 Tax=Microbaculum marinum TaxID=1764581 RepID=A0AAW9RVQ0_9HYPH